jgi:hypothetical protein
LSCTATVLDRHQPVEQPAWPKNALTGPERKSRQNAARAARNDARDRKKPDGLPPSGPSGINLMAVRSPRGRWRWPRSRPRGSTGRVGAGLKDRASPEMRPALLITTGPQPPKRHPSHLVRRHIEVLQLLRVTKMRATNESRSSSAVPGGTCPRPAPPTCGQTG